MLWSILIAMIPERYSSAHGLLFSLLETQKVARRPDVELIALMDNRRRTVGAKRNALLDMAQGEYVSFIDDDDMVAENYVDKLVATIAKARKLEPPTDVIVFPQRATLAPSGVIHECTYSLQHYRNRKPEERRVLQKTEDQGVLSWTGPPAHTMVWRRKLIEAVRFPEANFGEDVHWVDEACDRAGSEIVLTGDPMYFYQWDERKTATR